MPWDQRTDAARKIDFGEEDFFDAVSLNSPNAVAQCQVAIGFKEEDPPSGWPSENAIVNVYAGLDGGEWDVQPLPGLSFLLSQDHNPNRLTFIVSGVRRFRVGVRPQRRGAALATADFSYQIGKPEFEPPG
jgi:hypothetical protein